MEKQDLSEIGYWPEIGYWQAVAGYLADCHAANCEGLPKSTSKNQRIRLAMIAQISKHMLNGKWPEGVRASDRKAVVDRLQKAIENLRCGTERTNDP